jgi:hypothetical protein
MIETFEPAPGPILTEVMGEIKPRVLDQEFRIDSARSCQRSLMGDSLGKLE